MYVGGGGVAVLWSLWLLKRTLELLITTPMSPLQSIYYNIFYKNVICHQGIAYNPCPESCRERGCLLHRHNFWTLQLRWKKIYLKFWLEVLREMVSVEEGRGIVALKSLWLLKRALKLPISDQMSPIWNLYDCPFHKDLKFPHGITYNPIPRTLWGLCQPQSHYYMSFGLFWTKYLFHNFSQMSLVKKGVVGEVGGIMPSITFDA